MAAAEAFVDTNVVLYLLSADSTKAERAEAVIASGAAISVQVLNETASVCRRKLGMTWSETNELLSAIRSLCPVEPLTVETHESALRIAARYRLSVYDAMIVASALGCGCGTLYSEDMQDGLHIAKRLRIRNPFR